MKRLIFAALAALGLSMPAAAAVSKTLCVYDPSGAAGDAYQNAKKYQTAALAWGVNFQLKPYTDESVAAADFRNKKCDATLITGVRVQQFNKKTYSVEALGLLQNYDQVKKAVGLMASPKAAALNISNEYETVGLFPAGSIYLYVKDKSMTDVAALAGKKVCTMDFDPSAKTMVQHVGAQVEPADVGTFASKFNNGSCDIAYAPASAYKPLELHKGMGQNGGIIDFPVAQLTLQVLIRSADYKAEGIAPDFAQKSREWAAANYDQFIALTKKAETEAKSRMIVLDASKKPGYFNMIYGVRRQLVSKGQYDATVVQLLEQATGNK